MNIHLLEGKIDKGLRKGLDVHQSQRVMGKMAKESQVT
jgi:hypothetical protein